MGSYVRLLAPLHTVPPTVVHKKHHVCEARHGHSTGLLGDVHERGGSIQLRTEEERQHARNVLKRDCVLLHDGLLLLFGLKRRTKIRKTTGDRINEKVVAKKWG